MNNTGLSTPRKHVIDCDKRIRRSMSFVAAVTVSAAMVASVAGPASAVIRQPSQSAPVSLASSVNAVPAASLTAAAHYVHVNDGRVSIDILGAEKAGVSSQALGTASALAAGLNQHLDHETSTTAGTREDVALDVATAIPSASQNTSITLLPGIVLTINDSGIQLSMTKQAVTEVESIVGFGQSIASLVGSILSAAQVPLGGQIAGIVATSLGVGNAFLKLCTANDGSATFTVPWLGIPSCSGLSLLE